jgi:PAS domain S-box-containing protein
LRQLPSAGQSNDVQVGARGVAQPFSPRDLGEGTFRLLADHAPVLIWRADSEKNWDFVNKPWLDFTGRKMEAELGQGWLERVHQDDVERCIRVFRESFEARQDFSRKYRLRRHDGAWRWLLDNARPFYLDGVFAGYFGSCTDVSDMEDALARLRVVDAERQALVAELQHRVKNNIQATTSYLSLQAGRAPDPKVTTALRSAATRVLLASQVQNRLFLLDPKAGVDLCAEIETTVRSAYDAVGRPGIQLELDRAPEPLIVPASQATPLALIAAELMVNALRHGFPPGRQGRTRVALHALADGRAELLVEDDGVGIPEPVRSQVPRECLGLHLVPRLARQARGSLRMEGPPGTRAIVTFRPA